MERPVGRLWAIVRTLHLTLREGEALGTLEQSRDQISHSCPRIHLVTRGEWTLGGQHGGRAGRLRGSSPGGTRRQLGSGVFCGWLEVSYLLLLCVPGLFISCVTLGPGFNFIEPQFSHL